MIINKTYAIEAIGKDKGVFGGSEGNEWVMKLCV